MPPARPYLIKNERSLIHYFLGTTKTPSGKKVLAHIAVIFSRASRIAVDVLVMVLYEILPNNKTLPYARCKTNGGPDYSLIAAI